MATKKSKKKNSGTSKKKTTKKFTSGSKDEYKPQYPTNNILKSTEAKDNRMPALSEPKPWYKNIFWRKIC